MRHSSRSLMGERSRNAFANLRNTRSARISSEVMVDAADGAIVEDAARDEVQLTSEREVTPERLLHHGAPARIAAVNPALASVAGSTGL